MRMTFPIVAIAILVMVIAYASCYLVVRSSHSMRFDDGTEEIVTAYLLGGWSDDCAAYAFRPAMVADWWLTGRDSLFVGGNHSKGQRLSTTFDRWKG